MSHAFAPNPLNAFWDGDNIHIAPPQLHFLSGKPLERLKDGAVVTFLSQLTISTDENRTAFRRLPERFMVSYAIWEECFKIVRMGGEPRSVIRPTAAAAEAWCLESMVVSAAGLDPQRPFWLRFELRAAEPKEETAVVGEPGINITRMIEIFSRRPHAEQPSWQIDSGPLRLADLRKTENRGASHG